MLAKYLVLLVISCHHGFMIVLNIIQAVGVYNENRLIESVIMCLAKLQPLLPEVFGFFSNYLVLKMLLIFERLTIDGNYFDVMIFDISKILYAWIFIL